MITAADALRLPSAQLTDDEKQAADVLDAAIHVHLLSKMRFAGCDNFTTAEQNANVIAEVNQRLRRRGNWLTNWTPITKAQKEGTLIIGWRLDLKPNDAAYADAEAMGKN